MAEKKLVELPEKFGRYRILKLLGRGGMGAVYLARDEDLGREIAIKIPQMELDESSQALERFYQEARAAAAFRHPNICPVFEVGELDGIHYLTMAYIEGNALTQFGRTGKPLPQKKAAELVRKVALALAEAHQNGVIHRDLKPSNVMIDSRGEPIVMDFGLARRDRPGDSRITQSGIIMGSPAYMSPEHIRDIRSTGPSSDIYSLGVVLYELLAHRLPFVGDTMSVLSQVLVDPPPPPSKFRPDLDPALEAICLKAMAKEPKDRQASMAVLAAHLLRYLRGELAPAVQVVDEPPPAMEDAISASDMGGRRSMFLATRDLPQKKPSPPRKSRTPGNDSTIAEKPKGQKRLRRSKQDRSQWLLLGIVTAAFCLIVVGVLIVLITRNPGGISNNGDTNDKSGSKEVAKEDGAGNLLPIRGQFHPLFNGSDLSGWVVERGDDVWHVDGNEAYFNVTDNSQKGWLVTDRIYGDYLLSLQFKLAAGGNSSVALRMTAGEEEPLSVQIQDDSAPKWSTAPPRRKTGALFDVAVDDPALLKPLGQWNEMEIELVNRSLRVSVNGKTTLRKTLDSVDLIKRLPLLGRIGLEHNASSVRFRDVKIVEYTASHVGPPVVKTKSNAVNLLKLIDPVKDGVDGNWLKRADGILTPVAQWPRLRIPYALPPAYRIDMVVQRLGGPQFLGIGLGFRAGPARKVMLIVDGGRPPVSGLSLVETKPVNQNSTTFRGPLLHPLVPTKLSLTVRRGDIRFSCEEKPIFTWSGQPKDLSLDPEWRKRIPKDWDLFLMSQGECLVKEMTLTPLR